MEVETDLPIGVLQTVLSAVVVKLDKQLENAEVLSEGHDGTTRVHSPSSSDDHDRA
jgi:hypothetical protein